MKMEKSYPPTPAQSLTHKPHVCGREEYDRLYKQSLEDPNTFWGNIAEGFHWNKPWANPVQSSNFNIDNGPVKIEWFKEGETNLAYNCLDRHVKSGNGDKVAFYFEGNDVGMEKKMSYQEVLNSVCQLGNYLRKVGVERGDAVTIYMPMTCELPIAMLACARIGAVHSVVFAGFSAASLADRMIDAKPPIVITTAAVKRGAKPINLKGIVDEALDIVAAAGHGVKEVIVCENLTAVAKENVIMKSGRDVWWNDTVVKMPTDCAVEWMNAEDPLFRLYTSGSTGKPKGVEHTHGGYMVGTYLTFKYVFDYQDSDIYWCTADCGWITGHSYVTYGPMLCGASQVIFEGVPTYPDAGRAWAVVEKYKVNLLYTAPTAIRSLMGFGNAFVEKYDRSSLRILGTVGEPINPEAWLWYRNVVGNGKTPIVDTYWQTETGSHLITPLPYATALKPGSASLPFFGVEPAIIDENGKEVEGEGSGYLVIKRSWPSGMRTLSGDHERFENVYFSNFKGYYMTGDGAKRDEDGYYWLTGRVDDVINVSGHRIGTAEVEGALDSHPLISEAAVVPIDHDVKGQGIYAYVSLMEGSEYPGPESLKKELVALVRKVIGPIATPDVIHWAPGLPKTRSGKIMRRILRKIAEKQESGLGDTSTLSDPSVVQTLIEMRGK